MTEERDAFAAQELIKRYAPLEFVYPYRTSEPCVAVGCGVREDGGPPPYCSELCWLRATYAYQQEERGDDARLARSRRGGWRRVASRAVQATHRTHPGPAGERGSVSETFYLAGTYEGHEPPRTVGIYSTLALARAAAEAAVASDAYDDGAFVRAWSLDCGELVGHHVMPRGGAWESYEVKK